MTTAAPSYCVEICPPQWRGRMTGFYNCGWFGGSIPAAGITLGCSKINSDLSWRLPLIFQAVPSLIVICSVWFLPYVRSFLRCTIADTNHCSESPRWLMAAGREEEARAFLTRFHGSGDPNDPLVELEWAGKCAYVATLKHWSDLGRQNSRILSPSTEQTSAGGTTPSKSLHLSLRLLR